MNSNSDFLKFLLLIAALFLVVSSLISFLIKNSNNAKIPSMLTKTMSSLNQSVLMAKAKEDVDFASVNSPCPSDTSLAKSQTLDSGYTFCAIFNDVLTKSIYWGKVSNIKYYNSGKVLRYVLNKRDVIPSNYRDYYAYTLNDGTIVAFDAEAKDCSVMQEQKQLLPFILFSQKTRNPLRHCVGFIDVNGYQLPNQEVSCKSGKNGIMDNGQNCIVDLKSSKIADVYPVAFINSSVELATSAGKYVINNKK